MWQCKPDFKTACAARILAGGAHHTGFSQALTSEHMEDFAGIAGIEFAPIDGQTTIRTFQQDLRSNEVYFHIAQGLGQI